MQGRAYHSFLLVTLMLIGISLFQNVQAQSLTESPDFRPKKLWGALFQPSVKFSMPVGEGYTGMTGGFGFETTLWFATNPSFALGFSIGKAGLRAKKEGIPSSLIVKDDWSTSVWTFQLLFANYFYLDKDLPGKGMVYTYMGLGAASHKASGELWVDDGSSVSVLKLEDGPTRFSIPMGTGIQFGLSRSVMFNLSIGHTLVSLPKNEKETYLIFANSIIEIKAGLGFYIPQLGRN